MYTHNKIIIDTSMLRVTISLTNIFLLQSSYHSCLKYMLVIDFPANSKLRLMNAVYLSPHIRKRYDKCLLGFLGRSLNCCNWIATCDNALPRRTCKVAGPTMET